MLIYLGTWIREAEQVRILGELKIPTLFSYFELWEMQQLFLEGRSWGHHWKKENAPFFVFSNICAGEYADLFSVDRPGE